MNNFNQLSALISFSESLMANSKRSLAQCYTTMEVKSFFKKLAIPFSLPSITAAPPLEFNISLSGDNNILVPKTKREIKTYIFLIHWSVGKTKVSR